MLAEFRVQLASGLLCTITGGQPRCQRNRTLHLFHPSGTPPTASGAGPPPPARSERSQASPRMRSDSGRELIIDNAVLELERRGLVRRFHDSHPAGVTVPVAELPMLSTDQTSVGRYIHGAPTRAEVLRCIWGTPRTRSGPSGL